MNTHPHATAIAAAIADRADRPVHLGVRSCRMNVTALGMRLRVPLCPRLCR
jgi:hypothetical protein